MDEAKKVKEKIDNVLANKPKEKEEKPKEEKDKPTVWTPFAKKIYTDIELYFDKLGDAQPTRAVAIKFHNDIDEKLEKGKEKDSVIKYYNKKFKLPGVSTLPWNYFSESVIDPTSDDYEKHLNAMEKKYGHIPAWRTMIDGERRRIKEKKADLV